MADFAVDQTPQTRINPALKSKVQAAIQGIFPIESKDGRMVVEATSIEVDDSGFDPSDLNAQQRAREQGHTRAADIKAKLVLKRDGQVVQRHTIKLGSLPLMNDLGTFSVGGNDYYTPTQLRLKPGAYTREKDNGEFETFIPLKGAVMKVWMDPAKGVFKIAHRSTNVDWYPIMRALGVSDEEMIKALGGDKRAAELVAKNRVGQKAIDQNTEKLFKSIFVQKQNKALLAAGVTEDRYEQLRVDHTGRVSSIKSWLNDSSVDPYVTKKTLGKAFDKVSPDMLLAAARRILAVQRGDEEPDDRDAPHFKTVHGVEDLVAERVQKLTKMVQRDAQKNMKEGATLGKIFGKDWIDVATVGYFGGMRGVEGGLAHTSETANPLAILSERSKTTLTGPGGIGSDHAITLGARLFRPSSANFVDPVRTPEGSAIGVTSHLAANVVREGNKLTAPFYKVTNGKMDTSNAVYISAEDSADSVVSYPEFWDMETGKPKPDHGRVRATVDGKVTDVSPSEVQYVIPSGASMFDHTSNAALFMAHTHANRGMMAGKHLTQALPLVNREKPLVGLKDVKGRDVLESLAKSFLIRAKVSGTVEEVTDDHITISGTKHTIYNRYPMQAKVSLHHTPKVKVGDSVKKGDVIADSNYSKDGALALGTNLRSAYMPWKNAGNFEDAIVISESAASKLTSDHMHREYLELTDDTDINSKLFVAQFPTMITKDNLNKLSNGLIKKGEKVYPGEVLVTAVRKRRFDGMDRSAKNLGRIHKVLERPYVNASLTWSEDFVGEVIRVVKTADKVEVHIRTEEPAMVGDKLSMSSAAKGTISQIVPDDKMPRDAKGRHIEVIFNPHGVAGRINPSQTIEQAAGKLVKDGGDTYDHANFDLKDHAAEVKKRLAAKGLSHAEILFDPETGRHLERPVGTGYNYVVKLDHPVRKKFSARGRDGYTMDESPLQGKGKGGQSYDHLTTYALLGHNAHAILGESFGIRGTKNDDFWLAYQAGETPPPPKVPFVFEKFRTFLNAAGVDTKVHGNVMHFMPLSDEKILELSNGEIKNPRRVRAKDLAEEEGGLFDKKVTGGLHGCFHEGTMIWTSDGFEKIRDVVEAVNSGGIKEVWSYNVEGGCFELKPVIRGWVNSGILGRATHEYNQNTLPASKDHRGWGVLWATPGHNMVGLDGVKTPIARSKVVTQVSEVLNQEQKEIMVGHLLGDGCIVGQGHFTLTRTIRDKEYLMYTKESLGYLGGRVKEWTDESDNMSRGKINWRSKNCSELHELRSEWYPNGVKVIPDAAREFLTARALAIWLMDDGCVTARNDRPSYNVSLCTHGFSKEDVDKISKWVEEDHGISFVVRKDKKYSGRDMGYGLFVAGQGAFEFLEIVAPYLHPSMRRKLPEITAPTCRLCGGECKNSHLYCTRCVWDHRFEPKSGKLYYAVRSVFGNRQKAQALTRPPEDKSGSSEWYSKVDKTYGSKLQISVDPDVRLTEIPITYEEAPDHVYHTQVRTVYDLEVAENHNYVANGILVSNSNWSHIPLLRKIPHPLYEKVIRDLLDIKQSDFYGLIGHTRHWDKKDKKFVSEPNRFTITGDEAFKHLMDFDPKERLTEVNRRLKTATGSDRNRLHRASRYLRGLITTKMDPYKAYMTSNVAVMPPKYRSLVEQKNGGVREDPANTLYRDIILTRDTLNEAEKHGDLPESDLAKARLTLYDSYGALIGVGKPLTERRDRQEISGLVQTIKGKSNKTGLFQSMVTRRRNDYTGRSTIEPDANLGIDEIGIPEEMAWKIYEPIVIRRMVLSGWKPADASLEVKKRSMAARQALDYEMKQRPVVYNRAPSLHRWSAATAIPHITSGKEIKISPGIIGPTNSDFDGDTMAVHVPITEDARREAFNLLPSKNLYYDRDRSLAYGPEKDVIAGVFALTRKGRPSGKKYETVEEAISAFENNKDQLRMNSIVEVKGVTGRPTIGWLILKKVVPDRFLVGLIPGQGKGGTPLDKKKLEKLLVRVAKEAPGEYAKIVRGITQAGFTAAARAGGITATVDELVMDRGKIKRLLDNFEKEIHKGKNENEKREIAIKHYNEKVRPEMHSILEDHFKGQEIGYKDIITSRSTSKANMDQFQQILASPTIVKSVDDKVVPAVIKSSYGGGMRPSDYILTTPGARAGIVARSLSTALPGFLAKEVAGNMGPVRITEKDCGTQKGVELQVEGAIKNHEVDLLDRHLLRDIPGTMHKRNDVVTPKMLSDLKKRKIKSIWVRSPMTCESDHPPCQMCAGRTPDGNLHPIGANIGMNYGQAVSERSTQTVMRMFHSGGTVGSGDSLMAGFNRLRELLAAPSKVRNQGTLSDVDGRVSTVRPAPQGGHYVVVGSTEHYVEPQRKVTVKVGDTVKRGDPLSDGSFRPQEIAEKKGPLEAQQYVVNQAREAYQSAGATVRTPVLETIAAGTMRYVEITDDGGEPGLSPGDTVYSTLYEKMRKRNPAIRGKPTIPGISAKPLVSSNDLLERLNFQRLEDTIRSVPAAAGSSDLSGSFSPIPGLAYGANFRPGEIKKSSYDEGDEDFPELLDWLMV